MSGVMIRAYGELWNPELVEWGKKGPGGRGRLLGKAQVTTRTGGMPRKKTVLVDVWEQLGVYALLSEWRVVYVGRTTDTTLGGRLRSHLACTACQAGHVE